MERIIVYNGLTLDITRLDECFDIPGFAEAFKKIMDRQAIYNAEFLSKSIHYGTK